MKRLDDDMDYRCDRMKARTMTEEEWRAKHSHGDIVTEDYEGVQPPTYTLEQHRCLKCRAIQIGIRHRE